MGYNTSMIVLNDALEQIENDQNFGKKVAEACRKVSVTQVRQDISAGSHANAAAVFETHHADRMSVLAVGGNTALILSQSAGNYRASKEDILKNLAEEMGYKLVKLPRQEGDL